MKYINEFKESDAIRGIYFCKNKQEATTRNGRPYITVTLQDKTGAIEGKIWEPNSPRIQTFEKMDYIDEVHGQLGEKAARDINNILEANRALFAGGELDEEAKDAFYQAVTKAYLSCKMEAKKHLGEKRNQRKNRRCRIFRTPLLLHYNL